MKIDDSQMRRTVRSHASAPSSILLIAAGAFAVAIFMPACLARRPIRWLLSVYSKPARLRRHFPTRTVRHLHRRKTRLMVVSRPTGHRLPLTFL